MWETAYQATAFQLRHSDRAWALPWSQPWEAPRGRIFSQSLVSAAAEGPAPLLTLKCFLFSPHLRRGPTAVKNNENQPHPWKFLSGKEGRTGIKASCNPRIPQQLESLNNYGLEMCQKAKPLNMPYLTMNSFLCS